MPRKDAFHRLFPERDEEHPVDKKISMRFAHSPLRRRIRQETETLQTALGEEQRAWIALEASLNAYHFQQQEAYFNEGFAYGLAAGKARAFARFGIIRTDKTCIGLARTLRASVLNSGLPAGECTRVLLETAWAFCLGEDDEVRVAAGKGAEDNHLDKVVK